MFFHIGRPNRDKPNSSSSSRRTFFCRRAGGRRCARRARGRGRCGSSKSLEERARSSTFLTFPIAVVATYLAVQILDPIAVSPWYSSPKLGVFASLFLALMSWVEHRPEKEKSGADAGIVLEDQQEGVSNTGRVKLVEGKRRKDRLFRAAISGNVAAATAIWLAIDSVHRHCGSCTPIHHPFTVIDITSSFSLDEKDVQSCRLSAQAFWAFSLLSLLWLGRFLKLVMILVKEKKLAKNQGQIKLPTTNAPGSFQAGNPKLGLEQDAAFVDTSSESGETSALLSSGAVSEAEDGEDSLPQLTAEEEARFIHQMETFKDVVKKDVVRTSKGGWLRLGLAGWTFWAMAYLWPVTTHSSSVNWSFLISLFLTISSTIQLHRYQKSLRSISIHFSSRFPHSQHQQRGENETEREERETWIEVARGVKKAEVKTEDMEKGIRRFGRMLRGMRMVCAGVSAGAGVWVAMDFVHGQCSNYLPLLHPLGGLPGQDFKCTVSSQAVWAYGIVALLWGLNALRTVIPPKGFLSSAAVAQPVAIIVTDDDADELPAYPHHGVTPEMIYSGAGDAKV